MLLLSGAVLIVTVSILLLLVAVRVCITCGVLACFLVYTSAVLHVPAIISMLSYIGSRTVVRHLRQGLGHPGVRNHVPKFTRVSHVNFITLWCSTHPSTLARAEMNAEAFCTVLQFREGCDLDSYLKRYTTLQERVCDPPAPPCLL